MMTTYTRRGPGQSYIKGVLSERINSLIEHKDLNLEINPLKVFLSQPKGLWSTMNADNGFRRFRFTRRYTSR